MAYIQGTASTVNLGGGSTATFAFTGATAAGSLLITQIAVFAVSVVLNSVTDTQGNTWVVANPASLTSYNVFFAYALSTVGGSIPTLTYHLSAASTNLYASLGEYGGVNSIRGLGPTGLSGTSPCTSGALTTVANDLVIGLGWAYTSQTASLTAGTGYTMRNQINIGNVSEGFMDNPTSAGGSTTGQMSASTVGAPGMAVAVAAFFQAAAGGGTVAWTNRERRFVNKR